MDIMYALGRVRYYFWMAESRLTGSDSFLRRYNIPCRSSVSEKTMESMRVLLGGTKSSRSEDCGVD